MAFRPGKKPDNGLNSAGLTPQTQALLEGVHTCTEACTRALQFHLPSAYSAQ